MPSPRRRILFFAEGVTMTHFARPVALAQALDRERWEVHVRTPARYHPLIANRFDSIGDLPTRDPRDFLAALATGDVLYPADTLTQYVETDLRLIDELRPHVVVGDFRLSLGVSAPIRGVPYAAIFNAHWSPGHRQPAIVPQLPITRWIPPALLNPVYAAVRPWFYAQHARPMNQVRRAYGLPVLPADIRHVYTVGDVVLYPDVPELVTVSPLPAHHHFIGPCDWEGPSVRPAWWSEAMSSDRPRVFVSLGSSGALSVVPAILDALATLPVTVILSTSGRATGAAGANVYAADLLPYRETAARCALVVSHGGTGGLYPTLAAGTPMVAIPSNLDMQLSAALLERSGAGLVLRAERATVRRIAGVVAGVLSTATFRVRAEALARLISHYDSGRLFAEVLDRMVPDPTRAQR
jgi:UDP:flavonoid glycosyltransferase YjiC (YdhE family)